MDQERLTYLFGPEVLDVLDEYDLDEELDRIELVEQFLPLPFGAVGRERRMAIRSVVVAQALHDDPPEVWQTIDRLRSLGLDRDRVLSQVSMAVSEHLLSALDSGSPFDLDGYARALDALPLPEASDVERALVETVRSRQGIAVEELVERVVAQFAPSPAERGLIESLVDQVLDHVTAGPLEFLPRDVTLHIPDLAHGHTFTHRLTEHEVELGTLSAGFDLGAFASFDSVRLADGTELEQFSLERHHLGWGSHSGWLDAFSPGDLLAVTASVSAPDGGLVEPVAATVTITRVDEEPALDDEVVRAVREAYDDNVAEPGLPITGPEIALWLLFHRPDLFGRVQLPLSELCAAAGLERDGSVVAHTAEIWRRDVWHGRWRAVCDQVDDHDRRLVLGRALEVLAEPDADIDEVRRSLAECADDELIDVLADVLIPHTIDPADEFERGGVRPPSALFDLVHRAVAVATRPREIAVAEYLACVLDERCGFPDRAEEHLVGAIQAAPPLGPIVERMGWYRFDRGDARGALRWWNQLGEPHPAAGVIESLRTSDPGRRLGRNDPCWCGSGRKFKQCHQGATELPALPDRVAWLCRKATLWIEHSAGSERQMVHDLMAARATGDVDAVDTGFDGYSQDELRAMFVNAAGDPIVFDAALHEGRLFRRFLYERGALLPEDEQLLAASWMTVDRSVHEVVAVDRGVSMTVRDLASGEVVEVRERTASRSVDEGAMFCMRVVPDGAGHQIVGGIFPVRPGRESEVLDLCAAGDPFELCAYAGAVAQPPSIVHQPGMLDSMIDREALNAAIASVDGADDDAVKATVMAELRRQFQAAWLDDSVPALGGLTPRQAAADPTRRETLERLLDEFERSNFGTYDVAELRRELGL